MKNDKKTTLESHQLSSVQRRQFYANAIIAFVLLCVCLGTVYVFRDRLPPSLIHMILAVIVALMAGAFTYFMIGEIRSEFDISTPWGKFSGRATLSLAVFIIVLLLFWLVQIKQPETPTSATTSTVAIPPTTSAPLPTTTISTTSVPPPKIVASPPSTHPLPTFTPTTITKTFHVILIVPLHYDGRGVKVFVDNQPASISDDTTPTRVEVVVKQKTTPYHFRIEKEGYPPCEAHREINKDYEEIATKCN